MAGIKGYIISIISVSIVCSIVSQIIPRSRKMAGIIKVVCGLLMGITVLSPAINLNLPDYKTHIRSVYETANQISKEAIHTTREDIAGIIKEETEAYILNKASSLDMDVAVEVNLNEELLPESVVVVGVVAPYDKEVLENYIQQTLDVPEEQQLWRN